MFVAAISAGCRRGWQDLRVYGETVITPTHVVTNALLARRAARTSTANAAPSGGWLRTLLGDRSKRRWFVFGGLAPDLGLYALTAGAFAFYPTFRGLTFQETGTLAFDDLFYNDPVWLILQNTLHSPVVLAGLAVAGKALGKPRLLSFAIGCGIHTAMDIPVHHNDGPLYLFPLNWTLRFNSPVSYYDPAHYGNIVGPVDLAITLLGGAYLLFRWRRDGALLD